MTIRGEHRARNGQLAFDPIKSEGLVSRLMGLRSGDHFPLMPSDIATAAISDGTFRMMGFHKFRLLESESIRAESRNNNWDGIKVLLKRLRSVTICDWIDNVIDNPLQWSWKQIFHQPGECWVVGRRPTGGRCGRWEGAARAMEERGDVGAASTWNRELDPLWRWLASWLSATPYRNTMIGPNGRIM